MSRVSLLRQLEGGDRRSIGCVSEVVARVLADRRLFEALFAGLRSDNPVVRARAADAVEKVTLVHPDWLVPYKRHLLGPLACCKQAEVRWHVAQMLPRVRWTAQEQGRVHRLLVGYLRDASSIVKTCAMQALVDLTKQAPDSRPTAVRLVKRLTLRGTPAMRARGRKLLATLSKDDRKARHS
jgi:hypothetical protein